MEENALCGQTGLQAGDKILAVNGRRCFVANDILYALMRTEDYTADFTVLRDGKKVELPGVQFDTCLLYTSCSPPLPYRRWPPPLLARMP